MQMQEALVLQKEHGYPSLDPLLQLAFISLSKLGREDSLKLVPVAAEPQAFLRDTRAKHLITPHRTQALHQHPPNCRASLATDTQMVQTVAPDL